MPPMTTNPPLRDVPILSAQEESKGSTTTTAAPVGNNLYFDHCGGGGRQGAAAEESKDISNTNIELHVSVKNETTRYEIQDHQSTTAAENAVSEKNGDSVHSRTTTSMISNSSKMSHGGGGGATLWRQRMQDSLYERVEEESRLQKAFEKCCTINATQGQLAKNKTDFLLISGPSGSGKTRLAQSIKDRVTAQGGYYLTGKFDQFCRSEAYTAFVAAFTEFANMVLQREDAETVASMRNAIREAGIGEDESVLTNMIPALESLFGKSSSQGGGPPNATFAGATAGSKAEASFIFAFPMFIRAVCSSKRPVVLLLDNLQYADRCSLDLLGLIVKDRETQSGLLLLATCDDVDVSPDQYLSEKLRDMEDSGQEVITNIPLDNLARNRVQCVLCEALQLDNKQGRALANIVHSQTKGNFFYMIEFLQWLQDSKRIVLDAETDKWAFREKDIGNAMHVCSVGDFLSQHVMEQLPGTSQEVLKVAACLGGSINERFIEHVLDMKSSVIPTLEQTANLGVLVYDQSQKRFDFKDDAVQAAAYRLIPEAEREKFHLTIARKLWRQLDLDELDRYIFVVLSQMQAGRRVITKDKEKVAIAKLCLHGGKKAAKSSTFRTASAYLEFGISLLDNKRIWRDEYDLTLSLYNHTAEMSMCIADFERMDRLLEDIFVHARIFEDKVQAYGTKIYSLGSRGLPQESLDLGIKVLSELGESFPRRLCVAHQLSEFRSIQKLLKGKSDEQLLRIPLIENEQKLQALQILQLLILNALLVRPRFTPFVLLKCMKLTLKYGLSVMASGTFASYGMLCISINGDAGIVQANRFAKLSLILLERFEAMEYLPRVYAAVYGCIHTWTKPIGEALEPLLRAHKIGLRTGDIEFSALCAAQFCDQAYQSGASLDVIVREWKCFQDTITSGRSILRTVLSHIQAVHHFMGVTDDPLSPKGDLVDYDEEMQRAREVGASNDLVCICVARMSLAYVFNAYDLAAGHSDTVLKNVWLIPPSYDRVVALFYASLVSLAMARKGSNFRKNIRVSKQILKRFKAWSTQSPHNCLGRKFLIEAELASVKGQNARARVKFYAAIALARDSGSFMQALSNERAARHFLTVVGDATSALPYFEKACKAYKAWGGLAKVARLQAEMKTLYPPSEA